ncbi:YihY/virulence factor BrkB family protein [Beijerinckia sp. L45]|uniref:YihY/virulence factor BrkB family protein n=1 Tax=Beijerinckia sp. L45 TaxID=1641855 RepID=UPI00131DE40B|nr:YihY/virulence factor BrkB family protein [Beijerinckia sp. L45]
MASKRPSTLAAFIAAFALAASVRASYRRAAGATQRPIAVSVKGRAPTATGPAPSAAPMEQGRGADTPAEIPPRGWWDIAKRTATMFSENELMAEAAGVTFYALLAIFPAIAALISLYGLVADPKTIGEHLDTASGFLPGGGMDIIKEQVQRLTQNPASSLGFGAILGLATALWSANQGSKAVFSALNNVYDEKEKRGFIKLTAVTLGFTAGALVFLLIVMAAVVVLPIVLNFVGLEGSTDLLVRVARWPAVLVLLALFLAVLYRLGPSREAAKWRWISWGSAFAALTWIGLSIGFSWYVTHFGNYNKTYGSLGAVVGFMTWIWLSTTVILVGAQLNAEMELQTAKDTTTGRDQPIGNRGATRANRVA